jgi:glycosyltransferase involved in cell wall biosynthesis
MNTVFAHDHIFYKYLSKYYSNGGLSFDVLARYLEVFEEVKVISRQKEINRGVDRLTIASGKNIQFINVPNFKSIRTFSNIFTARHIVKKVVEDSDCVIARLPSSIGKLAVKYAKKFNKPYLVEVVGCAWDANVNYGSLSGKIIAPFEYFTNKSYIKNSNFTIYITENFLQQRYPTNGRTEVCPNVNIEPVNPIILSKRLKKIEEKNNEIKFGLIGSLDVDYKGHDTVINALGFLKKELPKFKVEFLGKGNQKRWKALIEKNDLIENVDFIGTLPSGNKVYEWMDGIDIILQPSYAEAQGRSIIEAMSRGCPIISSSVGGIVELIDRSWLINAGDYIDLSRKIKSMISEPQNQIYQSKRNFNEAAKYYKSNIDERRKAFLELFQDEVKRLDGSR